ncbi:MAG: Ca-activated chloride channel [Frankiaceae bacterium]|jgi:Ca-activated chloride channel family protein|nr:Ca-activated chloride channel [Frankiaceae bacterium]MDQ1672618.1 Ca-activated chloride channel [Frankiaceae bacterium]
MGFVSPLRLLLVLPLLAVLGFYLVQLIRRRQYAARFTDLSLLASVAPRGPAWWKRHLPAALLLLSLLGMVISLGRPTSTQKVPRERATVVLAIDVSNSMAADDVSPTRLRAAQDGAQAFVDQLPPRLNLGLVAFSGTASVLVSPTTDREAVRSAIDGLQLGPGTAIGDAVVASVNAITSVPGEPGQAPAPGRIVLLSDGETTRGLPEAAAAQEATAKNIPVSTIAYGTQDGEVTIQGQRIGVPVNIEALDALAQEANGTAYTAETGDELKNVYSDIGSSIGFDKRTVEIGRWFVGVALLLGLLSATLSVLWSAKLP